MINDTTNYTENSIRTFTGKVFDLELMDPNSICIEDIAHALSQTNRFAGHLEHPYSVAQHCCIACDFAPEHLKLEALLHDASEAYLGNMPSPFKKMLPDFIKIEDRLMKVIAKKFGFQYPLSKEIKSIDKELLDLEWESFVNKTYTTISYWSVEDSKRNFMYYYHKYSSKLRRKNSFKGN